ncbi:MAG: STAS domain-containing protein [Calditrichia bacterium]
MKLSEERYNDVVVISLEGSLMGGPEAVSLNEAVNRLLDEGMYKLVINLENVERMNSSGLGILIKALSTFKSNGGDLKLASLSPKIDNLLHITKINTILESYDTIEAAVNSF